MITVCRNESRFIPSPTSSATNQIPDVQAYYEHVMTDQRPEHNLM